MRTIIALISPQYLLHAFAHLHRRTGGQADKVNTTAAYTKFQQSACMSRPDQLINLCMRNFCARARTLRGNTQSEHKNPGSFIEQCTDK
jgi:hypothetical protein